MLGLLTRSRRPAPPAAPRSFRPSLERLETRDCPSTLTLNVAYGAGKQVTLYGQVSGAVSGALGISSTDFVGPVQDTGQAGVTVVFRGSATGSAVTDATGHFALATNASSLGEVDAATTDGQSNMASVVLSSSAPLISNFGAFQEGNTHYWDIVGHVTDGNFSAQGLTILINGSPITINNNGQGQTVTVDAFGNFDLCIQLNGLSSDNGNIVASVTDAWGLQSNNPITTISQPYT